MFSVSLVTNFTFSSKTIKRDTHYQNPEHRPSLTCIRRSYYYDFTTDIWFKDAWLSSDSTTCGETITSSWILPKDLSCHLSVHCLCRRGCVQNCSRRLFASLPRYFFFDAFVFGHINKRRIALLGALVHNTRGWLYWYNTKSCPVYTLLWPFLWLRTYLYNVCQYSSLPGAMIIHLIIKLNSTCIKLNQVYPISYIRSQWNNSLEDSWRRKLTSIFIFKKLH